MSEWAEEHGLGADPKESRARRQRNRENSAAILTERGVFFRTNNGGVHLMVGKPVVADFWPGTGYFRFRLSGARGRGVHNLLRAMGYRL